MKSTAQKSKKQKGEKKFTPTDQQYLQSAKAIVNLIDGADGYGIPDFLTLEIMDTLMRAAVLKGIVIEQGYGLEVGPLVRLFKATEGLNFTREADEPATFGGVTMYPFVYDARWLEHAQMLAEAASTYEDGDQNAAVIELVTSIAATKQEDDRLAIAYFVAERIFSRTEESIKTLDSYIREHRDAELVGSV